MRSGSPREASPTGAIRTRNKTAGSIAKRACDQCKFRKIKVGGGSSRTVCWLALT